jgi:hypothetical protein
LALKERGEQGQSKNQKVLRLPAIIQLKSRMRQVIWQETVEDVIKRSCERPAIRRLEKPLAA